MQYNFSNFKIEIKKVQEFLSKEYSQLNIGRASPMVLDGVSVESYGSRVPLKNVANISIEDPKTLRVAPWDKSQIKDVGKGIDGSTLGASVANDALGITDNFPPKLFGIKKGETEYTFNLLPVGGFVKIFGEDANNENSFGPDRERSFVHKAKWKQATVLFAGVFANFLLAWFLFSVGFMSGMPASVGSVPDANLTDVSLVVLSVAPNSPASKSGLKSGDK